jgi:hypothetical protein
MKSNRADPALPPLWTCPKCGHSFVTRNTWHSCRNYSLAEHMEGKEARVVALYEQLVRQIGEFGPVIVEPKKTGVAFVVRVRFAGAVLRKRWLEARLWLKRPAQHPRLRRTEKIPPRDYIHYFRIESPDDLDPAFVELLGEAYSIGRQEHLRKGV